MRTGALRTTVLLLFGLTDALAGHLALPTHIEEPEVLRGRVKYAAEYEVILTGGHAPRFLNNLDLSRLAREFPETVDQMGIVDGHATKTNQTLFAQNPKYLPLARLVPSASDDLKKLAKIYEWEEDAPGILEFRHRIPDDKPEDFIGHATEFENIFGGREAFDRFIFMSGEASSHNHMSVAGRSLRRTAALLNIALFSPFFRNIPKARHVQFNPVETKGLIRLFETNRIELRRPSPQFTFDKQYELIFMSLMTPQGAGSRALDILGSKIWHLADQVDDENLTNSLLATAEGLEAIEQSCPGCVAAHENVMRVLLEALESTNRTTSRNAAFLISHIAGVSDEIRGKTDVLSLSWLDLISPPEDSMTLATFKLFSKSRSERVQSEILRRLNALSRETRNVIISHIDELDSKIYQDLIKKEVFAIKSNQLNASELPLLNSVLGLPEDHVLRESCGIFKI